MRHLNRLFFRFIPLTALMLALMLILTPVLAVDPPLIRVSPQWRPGVTLDSVDTGVPNVMDGADDFRYVDVEIYVTTSVQFWTAQLNCTVAPTTLTSYEVPNLGNADPGDNVDVVRWGPDWGSLNNDFTAVVEPLTATGGRRITAAHYYGPLGSNGYNYTFLLATLRYRAKDIAANGVSAFTCTTSFLNKDGKVVLAAQYIAPPTLSILTGYTVTARATYQGRAVFSGIAMKCINDLTEFTVTSTTGSFTYNTLRYQGWYICDFFGNVTNPAAGYQPDTYLRGFTWFLLTGSSYQLLPVELRGGNVARNDFPNTDGDPTTWDEVIDSADLGVITAPANWERVAAAGDVNGDTRTDRADLTIAAGNFGGRESIGLRHAIYSLPRNWDSYRNSRIWLGDEGSGGVTQFVPGNNKDYWATLSPDGTRLAFARGVGQADCLQCDTAIYVAPINNLGVVGTPTRLTPTNWYPSNFAPSWSPDGTQLAFVCSWWNEGINGYMVDDGNVCVVDVTGRNLRAVGYNTRIYPPTWYTNNAKETYLVYGGSALNSTCANTLCIKNPLTPEWNSAAVFDADIDAGGTTGNTADMPRICNMQGCDHLFYRFNNGSTTILRWAQIDLDTNDIPPWETRAAAVAPYHMNVDYDLDGGDPGPDYGLPSTDIDYYTIAQNNYDIIYTETQNSWEFHNLFWDVGTLYDVIRWFPPWSHVPWDSLGNIDPPLNPGDPTERYALRNTVDFVP